MHAIRPNCVCLDTHARRKVDTKSYNSHLGSTNVCRLDSSTSSGITRGPKMWEGQGGGVFSGTGACDRSELRNAVCVNRALSGSRGSSCGPSMLGQQARVCSRDRPVRFSTKTTKECSRHPPLEAYSSSNQQSDSAFVLAASQIVTSTSQTVDIPTSSRASPRGQIAES